MLLNNNKILSYLLEQENNLSPFAKKSSESGGRQRPMKIDPFRLEFARDETRILHSPPFRRLKHKTQVFLSPDNDHICTRMEHVLHVSSIASVIGRCLRLNTDLINAIAKAHDLGHPPFGHVGERVLNSLLLAEGFPGGFKHEIHGLRVVDKLTNHGAGLNLTLEVRDGIISHCGEQFEKSISPDRNRDLLLLDTIVERIPRPSTLEGCLVRMVDKIAYLGRDLEDGIKAGMVRRKDIPEEIVRVLGSENGKIIGAFVNDTIANSIGTDAISFSDTMYEYMKQLKEFNYSNIYLHPDVEVKAKKAEHIMKLLFERIMEVLVKSERGANAVYCGECVRETPLIGVLFNFIKNSNYTSHTSDARIAADYIAGMTDTFALRSYIQLFLPTPVV